MTRCGILLSKMSEVLVAVARGSQALVIETLDRAAGVRGRRKLPLLHRVARLQLEFASLVLDDPARVVDDGHELFQRLTSLHREFAQRMFEVVDHRELPVKVTSHATSGRVLPSPTQRASTR